ncbi:fluoride efflux transporter CrcB [Thalassotalea profundi]|uniref:Fluoride-specific ion channel FluC n=1 Tax=Thalassotalea profundi TaxID=2036687 RepID=A0ABQ3ILA3_9GAMM|nr:fluoride efflux transporter CrcB [Thalassotalea profundi]GHE82611.1 putative fluoride ion transporter CrcB [Thalassotalea profundi]
MNNAISNFSLYISIAIGGACGASLRYFFSQLIFNWLGKGFPFATLAVNVFGSLIMGALYGLIEQGIIEVSVYRTLIGIGFLGAFTTFSTFSMDTLLLMQQGESLKAMLNVLLNVSLCVFACGIGMYLVTLFNK